MSTNNADEIPKVTELHPDCPYADWERPTVKWCEDNLCHEITTPANTGSNVFYILSGVLMYWWLVRNGAVEKYNDSTTSANATQNKTSLSDGDTTTSSKDINNSIFKNNILFLFPPATLFIAVTSWLYHMTYSYVFQLADFLGMFSFTSVVLVINWWRIRGNIILPSGPSNVVSTNAVSADDTTPSASHTNSRPEYTTFLLHTVGVFTFQTTLLFLFPYVFGIPFQLIVALSIGVVFVQEAKLGRKQLVKWMNQKCRSIRLNSESENPNEKYVASENYQNHQNATRATSPDNDVNVVGNADSPEEDSTKKASSPENFQTTANDTALNNSKSVALLVLPTAAESVDNESPAKLPVGSTQPASTSSPSQVVVDATEMMISSEAANTREKENHSSLSTTSTVRNRSDGPDINHIKYDNFWNAVLFLFVATICSSLDMSRTWCDPENHFVNGHSVWHLLSAVALFFIFLFYADQNFQVVSRSKN